MINSPRYTRHMIELLSKNRGFLSAGHPKSLGGPQKVSAGMIRECMDVMKTYVALCGKTLAAEFPKFDLVTSFEAFDLSEARRSKGEDTVEMVETCLTRLAQVFSVDKQQLVAEFYDVRPYAMHHATSHATSSFDAWRAALRKINRSASARKAHPTEILMSIMVRYGAFNGCTTSGVEQLFSRMAACQTSERLSASFETLLAETKIVADYDRCGGQTVCKLAASYWSSHFGPPRSSAKDRLDTGVGKRKREEAQEPLFHKFVNGLGFRRLGLKWHSPGMGAGRCGVRGCVHPTPSSCPSWMQNRGSR